MRSVAAAEFSVPPSLPYLERLMPADFVAALGRPYVMFTSVQLQSTIYYFFFLCYTRQAGIIVFRQLG
jgi:hypothetical protein